MAVIVKLKSPHNFGKIEFNTQNKKLNSFLIPAKCKLFFNSKKYYDYIIYHINWRINYWVIMEYNSHFLFKIPILLYNLIQSGGYGMLINNAVNILILFFLLTPIIRGFFQRYNIEKIHHSVNKFINNVMTILTLFLAIYLTKKIFFENDSSIYKAIYSTIPASVRNMLYGKDILTYILVAPIIMVFLIFIEEIIISWIIDKIISKISNYIFKTYSSMGTWLRRLTGAVSQIPRGLLAAIMFCFIINFAGYYFPNTNIPKFLSRSAIYQSIHENVMKPVLNSNIAKGIPVIFNNSFKYDWEDSIPSGNDRQYGSLIEKLAEKLTGGNIKIIEYFNGVTIDEAIISTPEIDEAAKKIVSGAENSKQKAYLLYKWIASNITYDNEKVEKVSNNPKGVRSGSIVAYETRKGICFDYSCLYVSMCRAVGLKVRLITGLAYSGVSWGDHAWNQVYCVEEDRWINVDATFGAITNYFDKGDFEVDHRYGVIQGEWQ